MIKLAYFRPFFKTKKTKKKMKRLMMGRFLYDMGRSGVKHIKKAQMKTMKNGVRIRKGIHFTVGQRSVKFHLNVIGAIHNNGVANHTMKYLQHAKGPIPIRLKNNELIFRMASKDSFKKSKQVPDMSGEGTTYTTKKWEHPGWKPKRFLEKGLKEMRKDMHNRINVELHKYTKK
jgi:hypothetical protein